jgi:hypothetical protein
MREKIDTTVTIEMFATPARAEPQRITIVPGTTIDIIDGAARVFFDNGFELGTENDWLHLRVNGRSGWITGRESFRASRPPRSRLTSGRRRSGWALGFRGLGGAALYFPIHKPPINRTMPSVTAPDNLRYPTGQFQRPTGPLDAAQRARVIDTIAATPKNLSDAVRGLNDKHLDTPYRADGWTVRQVVHHVADSHMNAYVRVKLALTENTPVIKTYDEAEWAKLVDACTGSVDVSLSLLAALHDRWVRLLRSLKPADFAKTMTHPDHGAITIDHLLSLYAWHGPHHVAHVTSLRKREGW